MRSGLRGPASVWHLAGSMKILCFVAIAAAAAAGPLGCHRASETAAAGDAAPSDGGAGQVAQPQLSASVAAPAQLSTTQAEDLGMQIARQRWPQYHPKLATSLRMNGYYKVSIQMLEPVGAHVILDYKGNYVDGGTSNGEH